MFFGAANVNLSGAITVESICALRKIFISIDCSFQLIWVSFCCILTFRSCLDRNIVFWMTNMSFYEWKSIKMNWLYGRFFFSWLIWYCKDANNCDVLFHPQTISNPPDHPENGGIAFFWSWSYWGTFLLTWYASVKLSCHNLPFFIFLLFDLCL